jgi:hypothetical protein
VKIVELEEAVDAASRLTEQIEKKEGAIGQLKKTITERDEALRTTVHALGQSGWEHEGIRMGNERQEPFVSHFSLGIYRKS